MTDTTDHNSGESLSSTSPRIELIAARPHHAPLLMSWRNDHTARQYNPFDDIDVDELALRLAVTGSDMTNRKFQRFRWLVRDLASGALVGTVSAKANWRCENAEIGYQIAQAHQRAGYAAAAVSRLITDCFTIGRLHRVFALISSDNAASIALIRKLGFQREGTLRQHHLILGRFVDQQVYGLLRG